MSVHTYRKHPVSPVHALPNTLIPTVSGPRAATLSPRELRRIVADMLG